MTGRRSTPTASRGLAARLMAGQTIVLVAGALTVGLVAALVGPPIFHQHLLEFGLQENSPELGHIELAYRDASLVSVGVGLLISLLAAIAVTWFLTRLLRRPLDELTRAARELRRGHYATRVPPVGSGTELDTLAAAFNTMAARLEGVEDTRRRMLADLAHELRTPIATLSAYHEGLHDGVASLGEESRAVLAQQTERLSRLADDIDDVSRAEEGRLHLDVRAVTVSSLLQAARASLLDRYAAKGVTLALGPSVPADLTARVDPDRIGQVLANLLANALRHTPPGGTVSVSARRDGRNAVLAVTDNGEGLRPDQLGHVFERFYRGDSARTRDRTGTGIGLTISRAIVDAHGGQISLTSAGPGHGVTVTLELPAGPD